MLKTEEIENLNSKIDELKSLKKKLQSEFIELDDKILYQNFGLYEPQYNFATIDQYKEKLDEIRKQQKQMIASKKAATCGKPWIVQGSEKEGKKLIEETIKQVIKYFNSECDLCINKVKFHNYDNIKGRILKSFNDLNKFNVTKDVKISQDYYNLKIEELNLAFEYAQKKKEEQEELRREKELRREEEKVAKEIEEKRKEYEKEQSHYKNALKKLEEQIESETSEERKKYILLKKEELDNDLIDVDKALKDLDYREANHRAGYVYVISNIGAFGENVYKIGMTRRLEPEDRIAELSGAAVPFKFDIHAMIFSNDAPKLEAALHNELADKKLNLVNGRKEFFNVTLDEIKKVVRENHDKSVDFINIPEAEQYRKTLMIRKQNKKEVE